jgi:hypothetical protein
MKRWSRYAVLAVLASTTAAAAGTKARKIERDQFVLEVPAGWTDLPDVANNAANAILGETADMTGGAIAYGDRQAGVLALVFWIKTKDKVPSVRPTLEAFHSEIKTSLESDGTRVTGWKTGETATRMTSSLEGTDGNVVMKGESVAAVTKDGRLVGWTAQCIYATTVEKKAVPVCGQVLASFRVTVADVDLEPLEKAKEKRK